MFDSLQQPGRGASLFVLSSLSRSLPDWMRPVHTGKGNTKIFLQTQEELLFDQISGSLGAGSSDPCNYPPGSQHTLLSSLLSRNLPLSRTLQQRIKSWINHKQKFIPDDSGSWEESSEFSTSKKKLCFLKLYSGAH